MITTLRRSALTLMSAAAVFSAASFRPSPNAVSSARAASPELERIYAPFDSLATDLNDYRWPLPDDFLTTSVFGDFRSTHFHGGIDISTEGREGIPVRAMRAGWVSLVRHAPHGYGNVVELTHSDGFTTWYAHLKGFAPRLDDLVRPLRQRSGGVSADVRPDSGAVRVEAGELIAYSGSTGAGGPHLHFEIRDAQRNPVDPVLIPAFRTRVADKIAPTIEELGLVPWSAGTVVQGDVRPIYVRPSRRAGAIAIDQRLRVTGDVGVTVRVRDAVGPRRFTNRNVALELLVDGVSVYASQAARLPADDSKQIALHYDWTAKSNGHPYHQKLFIEQGNRLPFYARAPYGSGILRSSDFTDGLHTLEVVARDLNGNESRLRADVVFNHPPAVVAERSGRQIAVAPTNDVEVDRLVVGTSHDGVRIAPWRAFDASGLTRTEGRWVIDAPAEAPYIAVSAINRYGTASDPVWIAKTPANAGSLRVSTEIVRDLAIVTVRSDAPLPSSPRVRILARAAIPEPTVRSLSARQYVASFALRPDVGTSFTVEAVVEGKKGISARGSIDVKVAPIIPSTGGIAELPDRSFHLRFGPNGVLADTYVRLERTDGGVRAEPSDRVLDEGATVDMEVPTELLGRKAGLFIYGGGDDQLLAWRHAFGERRLIGRVHRFLGIFRILDDETPPQFDRASLSYRSEILALELRIRDDRAGLSTSSIRVKVNGEPVPAVFDSDRRRLTVNERWPLPKGRHRVEVRASDRMENENVWVGTVLVK